MGVKTLNSASWKIQTAYDMQRAFPGIDPVKAANNTNKSVSYVNGTTNTGSGNQIYAGKRWISAGGYDIVDLAGGLNNPINDGLTDSAFARVKAVMVRLLDHFDDETDGNTCSSIKIGAYTASPHMGFFASTTSEHTIYSGGFYGTAQKHATGSPVSAGMADQWKITNNDSTVTACYYLEILGSDS